LASRKKKHFSIFAKSKITNELPWDEVIPTHYTDSFFVETWTRPAMMDNICEGKYKVFNVLKCKFGEYEYENGNEHGKWAVSKTKDVVCFGDLNRTESQLTRGGFVTCFNHKSLSAHMRDDVITSYTPCKKEKNRLLRFLMM
jgi:hypothetical protein